MSVETLKVQNIQKAWEDPVLLQSLLANPKNALENAFGLEIPPDIEIVAVEETPSRYYLVIPPKPEDLEDGSPGSNAYWS